MDNVDGFNWDDLQKVRVKTEVDDHGTDDATVQTRVKFIEGNEYGNNGIILNIKTKMVL